MDERISVDDAFDAADEKAQQTMKTAMMAEASVQVALLITESRTVDLDAVRALIDETSRSHTVMPFTNPTRYQREMQSLAGAESVLRAFLVFRTAVDAATNKGGGTR
jgi:hypothetical protein